MTNDRDLLDDVGHLLGRAGRTIVSGIGSGTYIQFHGSLGRFCDTDGPASSIMPEQALIKPRC